MFTCPQLVAAMRAAVQGVLQGLQLSQPISAEEAMSLLSDIHRGLPDIRIACSNLQKPVKLIRASGFCANPACATPGAMLMPGGGGCPPIAHFGAAECCATCAETLTIP